MVRKAEGKFWISTDVLHRLSMQLPDPNKSPHYMIALHCACDGDQIVKIQVGNGRKEDVTTIEVHPLLFRKREFCFPEYKDYPDGLGYRYLWALADPDVVIISQPTWRME